MKLVNLTCSHHLQLISPLYKTEPAKQQREKRIEVSMASTSSIKQITNEDASLIRDQGCSPQEVFETSEGAFVLAVEAFLHPN